MKYAACDVTRLAYQSWDSPIPAYCNLPMQPNHEFRASWIRYSGMWEKRDWQSAEPRNDDNSTDCGNYEGYTV